jgi:hypothetical protein
LSSSGAQSSSISAAPLERTLPARSVTTPQRAQVHVFVAPIVSAYIFGLAHCGHGNLCRALTDAVEPRVVTTLGDRLRQPARSSDRRVAHAVGGHVLDHRALTLRADAAVRRVELVQVHGAQPDDVGHGGLAHDDLTRSQPRT